MRSPPSRAVRGTGGDQENDPEQVGCTRRCAVAKGVWGNTKSISICFSRDRLRQRRQLCVEHTATHREMLLRSFTESRQCVEYGILGPLFLGVIVLRLSVFSHTPRIKSIHGAFWRALPAVLVVC